MELTDFGKGFMDMLQGAAQSAKDAVEGIDLSGVTDTLQETGGAVIETVKNIAAPKKAEGNSSEKADDAGEAAQSSDETAAPEAPRRADNTPRIQLVSARSAIKIVYYLMAADGTIFQGEQERFDSIGSELDPQFSENREQMVAECRAQIEKVVEEEDYYDTLQEGVELALESPLEEGDLLLTTKMLVWDLLSVAHSDESYDDVERRLIKYFVRKTGINRAVFLEMESSMLTVMDIEKEIDWIKHTDRPYLDIEAVVNELEARKSVIFESVKDLIAI